MNKLPSDVNPKEFEPTVEEQEKISEVLAKLDALLKLNDLTIIPTTIISAGSLMSKIDLIPNRVIRLNREIAKRNSE
jgi:hypothetical protein